jgi:hypothetical protein
MPANCDAAMLSTIYAPHMVRYEQCVMQKLPMAVPCPSGACLASSSCTVSVLLTLAQHLTLAVLPACSAVR